MVSYLELIEQLNTYLSKDKVAEVALAYEFAKKAHLAQYRLSGEPYISHPVEVAKILADLHMDSESIVVAILHDIIEDTAFSKEDILASFGHTIAELVDGLSKLTNLHFSSRAEQQAESFRKMMLAMAKDIRIIIIKLADRLHNLRTLESVPPEKRHRIALETIEIYAPIANRLGMDNFKREFEDLGFFSLHPKRYQVIKEKVKKTIEISSNVNLIKQIEASLLEKLQYQQFKFLRVSGRQKHIYALYRKMRKKHISFEEILDLCGFRIIVDNIAECYTALGLIHSLYKPVPGRFKDYIALPKNNGYQSLHTTLLGPHGAPIEVQIRTQDMQQICENGISAHWLYKTFNTVNFNQKSQKWLDNLLQIQKTVKNPLEFIENVKIDLYADEVFVFTPKGDIISLPCGATPVDLAYAIHTDIGDACVACKIDRRLSPLSTKLVIGQTVEIIIAEGAHPNPDWLNFAITGKAISCIKHWLKEQMQYKSKEIGMRILLKTCLSLGYIFEDIATERINKLLEELKIATIDEVYEAIGIGKLSASIIAYSLIAVDNIVEIHHPLHHGVAIVLNGTEGSGVTYATCCYPLPYDKVVGVLELNTGLAVHKEECTQLNILHEKPEKYVQVDWAQAIDGYFMTSIRMYVKNNRGVLAAISNVVAQEDSNIEKISIEESDKHHSVISLILSVKNSDHLSRLAVRLKDVEEVLRIFTDKR